MGELLGVSATVRMQSQGEGSKRALDLVRRCRPADAQHPSGVPHDIASVAICAAMHASDGSADAGRSVADRTGSESSSAADRHPASPIPARTTTDQQQRDHHEHRTIDAIAHRTRPGVGSTFARTFGRCWRSRLSIDVAIDRWTRSRHARRSVPRETIALTVIARRIGTLASVTSGSRNAASRSRSCSARPRMNASRRLPGSLAALSRFEIGHVDVDRSVREVSVRLVQRHPTSARTSAAISVSGRPYRGTRYTATRGGRSARIRTPCAVVVRRVGARRRCDRGRSCV